MISFSSDMGKRRTRKDKIIAQLRRKVGKAGNPDSPETVNFSYPKPDQKIIKTKAKFSDAPVKYADDYATLFSYDPKLINKDLLKTSVISILFFALEFGLSMIIS